MAMVTMNSFFNGKDSRWLQLEVCREFQRNKCSRSDTECKFAHPPANVEVQNGKVTACYDSIKGRCNREKPPCKYFHPPQHLKDQLLINGRNHLALKNALMQQMGLAPGQVLPAQLPAVDCNVCDERWNLLQASGPYLGGVPAVGSGYSPYFPAGPLVPALVGHDPGAVPSGLAPALPPQVMPAQKLPRTDRLEMDMKNVGSFYYENFAFHGMVPYKRAAADKSGVPVFQPATTYQQLMQLQQPFVPVSCPGSSSGPGSGAGPSPTANQPTQSPFAKSKPSSWAASPVGSFLSPPSVHVQPPSSALPAAADVRPSCGTDRHRLHPGDNEPLQKDENHLICVISFMLDMALVRLVPVGCERCVDLLPKP